MHQSISGLLSLLNGEEHSIVKQVSLLPPPHNTEITYRHRRASLH